MKVRRNITVACILIAVVLLVSSFIPFLASDIPSDSQRPQKAHTLVIDVETWDGGGANALASTKENWVGDAAAPDTGDMIVFNAGALPCTWDIAKTFGAFYMNATYTGIITQTVSFGVSKFTIASGTFTGATAQSITNSGDFIQTGGGLTNYATRLIMSSYGSLYLGGPLRLYNFTVLSAARCDLNTGDVRANQVYIQGRLTLGVAGVLNLYALSAAATNITGSVSGDGIMQLYATSNSNLNFPTIGIHSPVRLYLANGAADHRTITLIRHVSFGKTLYIYSDDPTKTLTLQDPSNYGLSSFGAFTLGVRAIATQGSAKWTLNDYTQSGTGSVFTQGGPIEFRNFTISAGTYTSGGSITLKGNFTQSGGTLTNFLSNVRVEARGIISDNGAWCWFADPRAIVRNNFLYIGYATSEGDVIAQKINMVNGYRQYFVLASHVQRDDHINPAILFRSDGRIIEFWSQHAGGAMYYRISTNVEDITAWGPVQTFTGATGYTYANPVRLSAEGKIYLFYRNGSAGSGIMEYLTSTNDGATWSTNPTNLFQFATGYSPYIKVDTNGIDTIWFAITKAEGGAQSKNDIAFCYYKDGAFHKADGTLLPGSAPYDITDLEIVYDTTLGNWAWIWDIASVGGKIAIVYATFPTASDHRYQYSYYDGATWSTNELSNGGAMYWLGPTEVLYSGGIYLDHSDISHVYLSRNISGILEIQSWITADHGLSWVATSVTSGSSYHNFHPITARSDTQSIVVWQQGLYSNAQQYSTALLWELQGFKETKHLTVSEQINNLTVGADVDLTLASTATGYQVSNLTIEGDGRFTMPSDMVTRSLVIAGELNQATYCMNITGIGVTGYPLNSPGSFNGDIYLNGTVTTWSVVLSTQTTGLLYMNRTITVNSGSGITIQVDTGYVASYYAIRFSAFDRDRVAWIFSVSPGNYSITVSGLSDGLIYRIYADGTKLKGPYSGPTVSFFSSTSTDFEIIAPYSQQVSSLIILIIVVFTIGIVLGVIAESTKPLRKGRVLTSQESIKMLVNMVIYIIIGMASVGILYSVVA